MRLINPGGPAHARSPRFAHNWTWSARTWPRVIGIAIIAILSFGVSVALRSACANEVLLETPSPDRKYKAVVFLRDCGATTGYSTQVSVIRGSGRLANKSGNVFIVDTRFGRAPSVEVGWTAGDVLTIRHQQEVRIFKQARTMRGIRIQYEPTPF